MMVRKDKRVVLQGLGASPGQALGPAFLLVSREVDVPVHRVPPEGVAGEIRLFRRAVREARREILVLRERLGLVPEDPGDQILASHLMILQDRELAKEIVAAIKAEQSNAAAIVRRAFAAKAHYLETLASEVFRARAADVRDVQQRLLARLLGRTGGLMGEAPAGSIVVAREITPSETLALTPGGVAGLVTEQGTLMSHVTILARSRGVPAVIGVDAALATVTAGEPLLLDGDRGLVVCSPNDEDVRRHEETRAREKRIAHRVARVEGRPGATRDGRRVPIAANIERPEDAEAARRAGAEGIGLFRTEFLFLAGSGLPGEAAQTSAYEAVSRAFPESAVTIRTLDVGGDKHLPYAMAAREENPFMGLRSVRFTLENPEIFRTQIEAILMAGAHGPVRILFPLITSLDEVRRCKAVVAAAREALAREGATFASDVPLGIMIEVPAAVWQAPALAAEVDFFSVGTNDLVQYLLAADRTNQLVRRYYDHLHPAVLAALRHVAEAARREKCGLSICGEMATEPRAFLLLFGLGYREFSLPAPFIPRTKQLLAGISSADAAETAAECLRQGEASRIAVLLDEALSRASRPG